MRLRGIGSSTFLVFGIFGLFILPEAIAITRDGLLGQQSTARVDISIAIVRGAIVELPGSAISGPAAERARGKPFREQSSMKDLQREGSTEFQICLPRETGIDLPIGAEEGNITMETTSGQPVQVALKVSSKLKGQVSDAGCGSQVNITMAIVTSGSAISEEDDLIGRIQMMVRPE
jgi:hypothetical protein